MSTCLKKYKSLLLLHNIDLNLTLFFSGRKKFFLNLHRKKKKTDKIFGDGKVHFKRRGGRPYSETSSILELAGTGSSSLRSC